LLLISAPVVSASGRDRLENGMAKKPKPITADRARRLYRLLKLLGEKAQTRAVVTRRLKLNLRGFYRDLLALRELGIVVHLIEGRYTLEGDFPEALDLLPLPGLELTFGDALQLAKGRTAAHKKLRAQLDAVTK
jgi:hypothetical protein